MGALTIPEASSVIGCITIQPGSWLNDHFSRPTYSTYQISARIRRCQFRSGNRIRSTFLLPVRYDLSPVRLMMPINLAYIRIFFF